MIREHKFVVDAAVVEFFAGRTKREREDLLRIFAGLAASPYQKGEWRQRTSSGRELQVKRFEDFAALANGGSQGTPARQGTYTSRLKPARQESILNP